MKLLVFAHTPPPHHGQSYMVQLMLEGFGGDRRRNADAIPEAKRFNVECYHVNVRLSATAHDIGRFQVWKIALLVRYCFEAIWCRFRYGIGSFYYVPAPGKRAALYRDWIVMLLCRPFFRHRVLHWHAAGMSDWLESSVSRVSRRITLGLLGKPDLSVVLSAYNRRDAERLRSKEISVVCNGISDPCPEFRTALWPQRFARFSVRQKVFGGGTLGPEDLRKAGSDPMIFKVLFLAHCAHEKGLYDAIDSIKILNRELASSRSAFRARLTVAGEFATAAEREEFQSRLNQPELHRGIQGSLQDGASLDTVQVAPPLVEYLGFVSGPEKQHVLAESDCLCFPTYYSAENVPVVLIEAMAFGLPVVTTLWRSLPELFPPGYPGLVEVRSPDQVAKALRVVMTEESGERLRGSFLRHFTLEQHLSSLAAALSDLES